MSESEKNKCFDAVNKLSGVLSDRAGVYSKDPRGFNVSEIGGVNAILPFLHLIGMCAGGGKQ